MRYSLPSREVIVDSIETVGAAENLNAYVAIGDVTKTSQVV